MAKSKSYKLVRSKRKTIALSVTADATLVVRAPMNTPLDYIERLVDRKIEWIRKAIARVISRPRAIKREFVDGESFLYLGKTYKLNLAKKQKSKLIFKNHFSLREGERKHARELLVSWYRQEAMKKITERVEWSTRRTGLSYKSIKISSANKRWGSCSTTGNLNFSWKLIMAPLSVIDYVVVHELAHLEHKNHSKSFWNSVKVMYPNYEKAKAWLRVNEGMLNI